MRFLYRRPVCHHFTFQDFIDQKRVPSTVRILIHTLSQSLYIGNRRVSFFTQSLIYIFSTDHNSLARSLIFSSCSFLNHRNMRYFLRIVILLSHGIVAINVSLFGCLFCIVLPSSMRLKFVFNQFTISPFSFLKCAIRKVIRSPDALFHEKSLIIHFTISPLQPSVGLLSSNNSRSFHLTL